MGYRGSYTVRMDLADLDDGQKAGMACIGKEFFCIGVHQTPEGKELFFEKDGEVLSGQMLDASRLWLRLSFDAEVVNGGFSFSYSCDGRRFEPFGEPFEAHFGYWKGARVALYSYNTDHPGGTAWFRDFRYQQ
jgi:hypothetical protein